METKAPTDEKTHDVPNTVAMETKAPTVNEQTKEQKAIDDWLPISSSRNAKWWYSAFHNVTTMVGAGVLSLPYAMAALGWGPVDLFEIIHKIFDK